MVENLKKRGVIPEQRRSKERAKALRFPESKEGWEVNFGVLTISGKSGTGKTSIANRLAVILGIPEENVIKIGQAIRSETHQEDAVGFIKRPISTDEEVDAAQIDVITGSDISDPKVIEGRLSGYLAKKHRSEEKPPVPTFLLTADDEIRFERIKGRSDTNEMPLEEIRGKDKNRADRDLGRWRQVHPELEGQDPYDSKFYDRTIDTDKLSVDEVVSEILKFLMEKGYVVSKNLLTPKSPPAA